MLKMPAGTRSMFLAMCSMCCPLSCVAVKSATGVDPNLWVPLSVRPHFILPFSSLKSENFCLSFWSYLVALRGYSSLLTQESFLADLVNEPELSSSKNSEKFLFVIGVFPSVLGNRVVQGIPLACETPSTHPQHPDSGGNNPKKRGARWPWVTHAQKTLGSRRHMC